MEFKYSLFFQLDNYIYFSMVLLSILITLFLSNFVK